jgi:hypothetical protein
LFARAVAVLIAMRTFCPGTAVIVDAWYRNRSSIRIDANGPSAIFEGVLRLRSGARQQECGDSEKLFHH